MEGLFFSSVCSSFQSPHTDAASKSIWHPHPSVLVVANLVAPSTIRSSDDSTGEGDEDSTTTTIPTPPTSPITLVVGSHPLFGNKLEGLAQGVQETIQSALRPSTLDLYQGFVKRFANWCVARGLARNSVSEAVLLEYLQQFVSPNFAYSYVRTMYWGLTFMMRRAFPQITRDPLNTRDFLRGAAQICRPRRITKWTWDPQQVLSFVLQNGIPRSLADKAAFTAVLLRISIGVRSGDLARLSRVVKRDPKTNAMHLSFLSPGKSETDGAYKADEIVPKYPGNMIWDVTNWIDWYIEGVDELCRRKKRTPDPHLFVNSINGDKIDPKTFRSWILGVLAAAGVKDQNGNLPTAHSVRAAITSSAYFANLSFNQIAGMAGWKRESTFARHYKCPIRVEPVNFVSTIAREPTDSDDDESVATSEPPDEVFDEDDDFENNFSQGKMVCALCLRFDCPGECIRDESLVPAFLGQ